MHSSASSSIIVSNTGETGSLFGKIIRAGATSIQELKYVIPFAIVVINRIALSNCPTNTKKFSTIPRRQRDPG